MAIIPFIVTLNKVLVGTQTGRVSYQVSQGETLEITHLLQKSTGAFDIYGISDSRGTLFSDAASGDAIDGDMIADVANANNGLFELPSPLLLPGGTTLFFDLIDTSGAGNTVEILAIGKRYTGSDA